jgi:ubiquinone/menaquinone biosynthesis C-methylase UbiE
MLQALEDRVLDWLAQPVDAPESGSTASYTLDNCLDFPRKTLPDFDNLVRGKRVLDFGCGPGWQAATMAGRCGAAHVTGLDINQKWLQAGRDLAQKQGVENVEFTDSGAAGRTFDLVLSISAFEHFADPAAILGQMRELAGPDGRVAITWAEPWYSHSGSHVGGYTRLPILNRPVPWANLLFSERGLLKLRTRYRADRPTRYEEIEGGLNRMTVARFERIIGESGMRIEHFQLFATAGLPLVTKIPVARELLTGAACCILRR